MPLKGLRWLVLMVVGIALFGSVAAAQAGRLIAADAAAAECGRRDDGRCSGFAEPDIKVGGETEVGCDVSRGGVNSTALVVGSDRDTPNPSLVPSFLADRSC